MLFYLSSDCEYVWKFSVNRATNARVGLFANFKEKDYLFDVN